MENKLEQLSHFRKVMQEKNKQKYNDDSKKRFMSIVKKKTTTSFVGAISEFEKKFGFLWGFMSNKTTGFSDEELWLKKELARLGMGEDVFLEWWQEVRNNIFHNGNNQLRSLEQEIEQYTVYWNRYTLISKGEDKDG